MIAKGYVVRGKLSKSEQRVYVFRLWHVEPKFRIMPNRAEEFPDVGTALFATLPEAAEAYRGMGHLRDIRIFAVAEDGTETPLPTYEEALAENERLREERDAQIAAGMERHGGEEWRARTQHEVDAEKILNIEADPDPLAAESAEPAR